ncbi:hypothetical protein [Paracoccus homiensis]|uniref:Uncharacterized protein n=1 Tax=Paracoccus homiensis TaxID=364199 RepID=A0A1I0I2A8_9RHOB|nr:hypothetical protein [Paracoccus homiensis]SET90745.1 hypothetical protein SAMN04489858_1148 [Paracoccus homiensis]
MLPVIYRKKFSIAACLECFGIKANNFAIIIENPGIRPRHAGATVWSEDVFPDIVDAFAGANFDRLSEEEKLRQRSKEVYGVLLQNSSASGIHGVNPVG